MKATSPKLVQSGYGEWCTRGQIISCHDDLCKYWDIPEQAEAIWIEASTTKTEEGRHVMVQAYRGFGNWVNLESLDAPWETLFYRAACLLLDCKVVRRGEITPLWITVYWE